MVPAVNPSLEDRIEILEQEVATLKSANQSGPMPQAKKDWRSTFGWARHSAEFDRAMDAGEAYRKAQTFDKEKVHDDAGA
jgi:hypothetical protein